MKKIFAILLSVLLLIGLAACGPKPRCKPTRLVLKNRQRSLQRLKRHTFPLTRTMEPSSMVRAPKFPVTGDALSGQTTRQTPLIRSLIDAYGTIVTDFGAAYVVNPTVVEKMETEIVPGAPPEGQEREEGVNYDTKIFKITIKKGLTYNNGDPITAKDFIASALFACTQEMLDLGAKSTAALTFVGGEAFQKGEADVVTGIRLYDDYTFSFEIVADKLPYYYDITYAGASPMHYKRWFGEDVDIKDDGEGAYFNEAYTLENITPFVEAERFASENRVSAGPYTLETFDKAALQATLVANDKFAGDLYGNKPEVKKIVIIKAEDATWGGRVEDRHLQRLRPYHRWR